MSIGRGIQPAKLYVDALRKHVGFVVSWFGSNIRVHSVRPALNPADDGGQDTKVTNAASTTNFPVNRDLQSDWCAPAIHVAP